MHRDLLPLLASMVTDIMLSLLIINLLNMCGSFHCIKSQMSKQYFIFFRKWLKIGLMQKLEEYILTMVANFLCFDLSSSIIILVTILQYLFRNVSFDESIYPFQQIMQESSPNSLTSETPCPSPLLQVVPKNHPPFTRP
jgi:hypothetical protein